MRRAPRVSEPGVVVYYWDGSTPIARQIRDISLTGAYLYTGERWYPGTIIRLLLQGAVAAENAPGGKPGSASASIPARVVRHGSDGVAVEFLFRDQAERKFLMQLLPAISAPAGTLKRGQALIEFALVVPLLFVLIVNAINFGSFIFDWITIANAARAGAQYWVLGSASYSNPTAPTAAQVTTLVTTDISTLLNRSSLVVRVCTNNNTVITCTGTGTQVPAADPEPASYISASVDVTYTYVPPIPLFSFPSMNVHATLPPTKIHRQAVMRVLQ